MKIVFKPVAILYNPKSSGPSQANAEKLAQQIVQKTTNSIVKLIPTKYPGHAEKLAAQIVRRYKSPLIISSSGDGTYHELINGIMKTPGSSKVVAAVLPSGNANDHARAVHESALIESILANKTKPIGLVSLSAKKGSKTVLNRWAHSYIGFGVSSAVARSLNQGNKTVVSEKLAGLKALFNFRPFRIKSDGEVMRLDSLIANNIAEMAKALKIAKNVRPEHNSFGLSLQRHRSRLHLISYFSSAAIIGVTPQKRLKAFEFQLLGNTSLQMDGETYRLKDGATVTIKKAPDALRTLS